MLYIHVCFCNDWNHEHYVLVLYSVLNQKTIKYLSVTCSVFHVDFCHSLYCSMFFTFTCTLYTTTNMNQKFTLNVLYVFMSHVCSENYHWDKHLWHISKNHESNTYYMLLPTIINICTHYILLLTITEIYHRNMFIPTVTEIYHHYVPLNLLLRSTIITCSSQLLLRSTIITY